MASRCGSTRWPPDRPALPRKTNRDKDKHRGPFPSDIDRRALITGRILNPDRVVAPPEGEIASIIVQARPENLDEVAAAITSLAGCEVHGRDPRGKLIVVVDAPDTGSLGTTLNTISLLPHVHTPSLVFPAPEIG